MVNLEKVDTWGLIRELERRGYFMKLIFGTDDVIEQLRQINAERIEADEPQIVLDEYEIQNVIDSCFNEQYYCQRMNEDIADEILNQYDSAEYHK